MYLQITKLVFLYIHAFFAHFRYIFKRGNV